jgi:hypothetical protein
MATTEQDAEDEARIIWANLDLIRGARGIGSSAGKTGQCGRETREDAQ